MSETRAIDLVIAPKPEPIFSNEDFERLKRDTFAEIDRLTTVKGAEYSGDVDRLANFRRNGAKLGLPKEAIWSVYAGKHADAIDAYIKDIVEKRTRKRSEPISGRIDDMIAYLLLLKAMVEENERS